jgi:hypothetical protein
VIYFYIDCTDQKIKSDHHPLFIPNIPFFHHSIIPLVSIGQHHPSLRAVGSTSRKLG